MLGNFGTRADKSMPPSAGLSLRRNFSWTVISNIIYAACQWGVIVVLAKLGNPTMIGQFTFALAIIGPIDTFLRFQLRSVQATDATKSYLFCEYFVMRIITVTLTIFIAIMAAASGEFGSSVGMLLIVVATGKAIDAISDVFHGAFQLQERMDVVAKTYIVNGISSLILMTLGIWIFGNVVMGALGYILGSLIPLLTLVIPQSRRFPEMRVAIKVSASHIIDLLQLVFPLGIVVLLNSLGATIPRYYIERHWDTNALGVFAALSYLIVAGGTVVDALGQAVAPQLSRLFAGGEIAVFRLRVQQLMLAGIMLGFGGFVLSQVMGGWILRTLYSEEYVMYRSVLDVLSIGAGFTFAASFAGIGLTSARRIFVQAPRSALVTLAVLLFCAILIPRYGLMGAAFAIAGGAIFRLGISYWLLTATWSKDS